MLEIDPLILEYVHLKEKPREAEALQMLQKIASLVKPIMRQRSWKVGTLGEFFPQERNLLGLNINRGQQILVRLRHASDEKQFLPLEMVVDTMLHELSHIVHGPHDAKFHALWNQLREEHEQLLRKGYTGEGFLSEGRKLGGTHIPQHEARRIARDAAEKRRVLNSGSGQKLGGRPILRGTDMRKVIADAAQRRRAVEQGCGLESTNKKTIVEQFTRNGFRTQAEEDDANERAVMQAYMELIQEDEKAKWGDAYIPPSKENPAGNGYGGMQGNGTPQSPFELDTARRKGANQGSMGNAKARPSPAKPQAPKSKSQAPSSAPGAGMEGWACDICTLVNIPDHLCCNGCGIERPGGEAGLAAAAADVAGPAYPIFNKKAGGAVYAPSKEMAGWLCRVCSTHMDAQSWICSGCKRMKLSS
ncbi:MAG: hypothetical protein M1829_003353 [Trizodia sp. TS-e1964]|nr:MAG: hypothetical protein M1829_003353 [Trizodia sp. TS-e1964]